MGREDRPDEEKISTEPQAEESAAAPDEEASSAPSVEEVTVTPVVEEASSTPSEQEEVVAAPSLEEASSTSSPEEAVNTPSEQEEIVQLPASSSAQELSARARSVPRLTLVTTVLLFLATALAVGLPSFFLSRHTPEQTIYKNMSLTDSLLTRPYSATVPGSRCDLGGARWAIGQYFKTSSGVQETPQTAFDTTTEMTCKPDGLLVTKKDHFNYYATLVFEDRDSTALPRHFKTQITSTIVSSQQASVELGVRVQKPGITDSEDSGYGNDTLTVREDGTWEVRRVGNTSGSVAAVLAHGKVQPAKTFTLAAEVNGPAMTFSINGHTVATVSDTTYQNSHGISFGVADPTAKSSLSALFSHFTYTPLS
ncbi:hypothetical protein KSF_092610 [Reticulibacter mediterranei]|uniref:Uncharacterized protein n=1 Tax=Reticulibacter mediterranei TaxID=2778369 RepID=A0A8J3IRV4_9CHLR|nr:hypothetical protein [Reticulibacter mediterranei]GHO99213.1 hypothetical protein KSF_092610 [Reticulibacter mediterranei]